MEIEKKSIFNSEPLRNRSQYGIRCPRDLLGRTLMKEKWEGSQRGLEESSHCDTDLTAVKEREKNCAVLKNFQQS